MAYDPTCAETKAALAKAVQAALAQAADDHDADVAGLKAKNRELLKKLATAEEGGSGNGNTAEVERLEGELRENAKKLRKAETDLADAVEERDAAKATAEKETGVSRKLLTENGLTAALTKVNVKPELLPAVTALLQGKVEIKEVAGERKAFADGKPLGEFVEAWSQGDDGKHYIAAPLNGGGGSASKLPGQPQGGDKKLTEMNGEERKALQASDPAKFDALVQAQREEQRKASRRPRGI